MTPVLTQRRSGRAVGRKAGLTLQQIIEAARSLDPDELTMQALANRLGVDRKAINHHVSDRGTLTSLVAMDAFSSSFSAVEIGEDTSWQEACRSYAHGFADSAIATGPFAEYIQLTDPYVTTVLEPTEAVLAKMVDAGFDPETAMRSLSLLSNICLAYARDITLRQRTGVAPRAEILEGALESRDAEKLPTLATITELPVDTYDRRQLEISIQIHISGTESLLGAR